MGFTQDSLPGEQAAGRALPLVQGVGTLSLSQSGHLPGSCVAPAGVPSSPRGDPAIRHSEPFFGSALLKRDVLFSVPVVSELKTTGRVHSPLAFCLGPEKDVAPVLVTLDITQEDGGVAARALSLSSCLGRTDSLPEPCSVPHRPAPQPLAWVNPWPVQPALPFARS